MIEGDLVANKPPECAGDAALEQLNGVICQPRWPRVDTANGGDLKVGRIAGMDQGFQIRKREFRRGGGGAAGANVVADLLNQRSEFGELCPIIGGGGPDGGEFRRCSHSSYSKKP